MMNQWGPEEESRKVLNVRTDASLDDIKKAYRRLSIRAQEGFRSHPMGNQSDTNADDARMQFRRVHFAYLCLREGASKVENSRINWRPSETCIYNDDDNGGDGHRQMPTFEDAEKAFSETFGRININPDRWTLGQRACRAVKNQMQRASSMGTIYGATGTAAQSDALKPPPPRQRARQSPLAESRFDPKRATA